MFVHRVTVLRTKHQLKAHVPHIAKAKKHKQDSSVHKKHIKPVVKNQIPFHSLLDVRTDTLVYTEPLKG